MANILYEPDDFTIVDVIGTTHQELNEDVYSSLKGKSILNLIDPAYVAKFLADHYASFHTQEPSLKSYQFRIGDQVTFCDIQFLNANSQKQFGELNCHPALLANLVRKVRKQVLPQILQDSRLTVLVTADGVAFHCPKIKGVFAEYLSVKQLIGKQLFEVLQINELFSGKSLSLETLFDKLDQEIQALLRFTDNQVYALVIVPTKVQYADAPFYCLEFEMLSQAESDINSPFILNCLMRKFSRQLLLRT